MSAIGIAVLGAGGQVGSNLLTHLTNDPALRVWGICRNEVTAGSLRLAGLETRVGDVTQATECEALFAGADVVVNCAAASGLPAQARREEEAILSALASLPASVRIIHFSSVAVYGTCIDARRNQFERPRPDWAYGHQKLHLERFLTRAVGRRPTTIIRMGHVYGAGQWLSRAVLDLAQLPEWRLPFDGAKPSNAVHVRNVATAIRNVILDEPRSATFNLFDPGQSTWREVFDWNTSALGWEPVTGQSADESEPGRLHHQHVAGTSTIAGLVGDSLKSLRSAPSSFVASSPAAKKMGLMLLATTKSARLEGHVLRNYQKNCASAARSPAALCPPYYYADAAPGPVIRYESDLTQADQEAVATWFTRLMDPAAILAWDAPDVTARPLAAAVG